MGIPLWVSTSIHNDPMKSYLKGWEFTPYFNSSEMIMATAPPDDVPPIFVTGQRLSSGVGIVYPGGGSRFQNEEPIGEGGGGGPGPGPEQETACVDLDAYPPEERENVLVLLEAAKIQREILATGDKDTFEYGSLIYRNSAGVITHTPILRGGPTYALPDVSGLTNADYGRALALVHSHTAAGFVPALPLFRLGPTPDSSQGSGAADGAGLSFWADRVQEAFEAEGMTPEAARAAAEARLSQIVIGATGPSGTNSYGIAAYDYQHRNGPVDEAAMVDPELTAC
jgi:hypothetical protein